ncbi:hypothetical protein FSARC_12625 [Fusarium sarcochroum]|uniref:ATP-dependent DNA helicase n=1 Tax=Fusarium sarcochroum TaxID=1208366 RepID=A0A8H4T6Z1_9HYPO|nr:hypothetical protein FSARC_12625 [Fusarium sarcochroum]
MNPDRQQPGQQRDLDPLIDIIPNPTFGDLAAVTYCRFYFPRALHDQPILARNMNPNYPTYDGSHNDTQLNNFNRTPVMAYLANIDTFPCTSQAAVINYVVKYVGKAEKKSENYTDVAKAILPRVNSSRGVVGFVAKFMNRLIAERDWSAQEVQHLLLNLDLTQGTRVVLTVDCHHPREHWRAEFIPIDGEESVRSAKNTYQKLIHHDAHPDDYLKTPQLPLEEEEFEEDPDGEDEVPAQSWEELAAAFPQDEPDTEEVALLGKRPIDLAYEWDSYIGKHPQFYSQQVEPTIDETAVTSLNPEQRLVYDLFVDHLERTIDPYQRHPPPLLLQLDGQGGIGKSYLMQVLSTALNARQANCVVRVASTGIAANAINGATMHSMLRLPISKQITSLMDLSGGELNSLQASLSDVKYIILDENSIVGLKAFHFIDQRLRQVFLDNQHGYFGGRSVLLLGDFHQLAPVFEKPLYGTGVLSNVVDLAERNSYRAFDKTVELKQMVRQQGDDQAHFRDALQVRDFNCDHMERLRSAVITIHATHSNDFGNDAESSVAGNLHKILPICIGARVMLTENVWTAVGLVNGAIDIDEDIAWEDRELEGVNPRRRAPEVVMVRFEDYKGPLYFDDDPEMSNIVPVFRSTREYVVGSYLCSRKQLPLAISYAITFHKSQGTSLDKPVAELSGKDFTVGFSCVARFRAETLQGTILETAFE